MKEIRLSQGKCALVDDDLFEYLSQWKWHARRDPSGGWYAQRTHYIPGRGSRAVQMHRQIIGHVLHPRMDVDHVDRNGLNNQGSNLRLASRRENASNRGATRSGTSGFKGVTWYKKHGNWLSQIRKDGKRHHLGYFQSKIAAAIAFNIAAVRLNGVYAFVNDVFSGRIE